jgi:subtilisin-like proprotein convertase family protein
MIKKFVCLITIVVVLSSAAYGQNQPPSEPAFPHENLYYYNGNIRVDVVLALDELYAEAPKNQQLNTRALATGGTWQSNPNGSAVLRMGGTAITRADLQTRLGVIRAAGNTARPVLYAPGDTGREAGRQQVLTERLSLKLKPGTSMADVSAQFGLNVVETVSYSPNTYIVSAGTDTPTASLDAANALYESGIVEFATPVIAKPRALRLIPNDSLFGQQWHLENTGQVPFSVAGNDVNIVPAWDTVTGAGVNIAVVDTGVQVAHSDLAPNARTDIDIDVEDGDLDPSPQFSSHGTSVAGIAAAKGNNGFGVTGAGFNAGIIGVRLIDASNPTDVEEATALTHQVNAASNADEAHVFNNSWGPTDDGQRLETMGPLTAAAIASAVTNGRGGLGTIYVWAGGNGRPNDNVNYDGYASSRYTIAVGASGGAGNVSYYSETGASLLVNTPSSYTGGKTTTTEASGGYTPNFGGTSSASPLAAGIVALMLETNPGLTWRDVQHILVQTTTKNDPADPGWFQNGANFFFNHDYGFGRVDAAAAVTMASTWINVEAEAVPLLASESSLGISIPDNNPTGISRTLPIAGAINFKTEHVEVTVNISHAARGNLRIELTSPSGTTSVLAETHNDFGNDYANWMFTTVANWGENPSGSWTLRVIDGTGANTGTLNSWTLTVYGTALNEPIPTLSVPFFTSGVRSGR